MHITAVAVSPDGRFAATGTETLTKISTLNQPLIDNRDPVRLWDLSTGQLVKEYGPLRGGVKALRFSPNGKVLVSCQNDLENKETVWLWDVQAGQLLERVRTPRSGHEFFGCAVSANGRTVAAPVLNSIYLIDLQQ
jgi:WD40 repeat protein